MICKFCSKDFHYCCSCGYVPEAELGCCSDKCAEQYITLLCSEKERNQLIAEQLHLDRLPNYSWLKTFIKENKEEIALALLEYALKENGYELKGENYEK